MAKYYIVRDGQYVALDGIDMPGTDIANEQGTLGMVAVLSGDTPSKDRQMWKASASAFSGRDFDYNPLNRSVAWWDARYFDPVEDALIDLSGNGHHARFGSSGGPTAGIKGGEVDRYLELPGTGSNGASSPDTTAAFISGDLDIRVHVALDQYASGAEQALVSKFATSPNYQYMFRISGGGGLSLRFSEDGSTDIGGGTPTPIPAADGEPIWLRATLDVDNGSGNHEIKMYTSSDGVSWTQLGATDTNTGVVTLNTTGTDDPLYIGTSNSVARPTAGKVYRAQVYDGIDGTLVADFNPNDAGPYGIGSFQSSSTGETWTIDRSAEDPDDPLLLPYEGEPYLYLPGASFDNNASTPDTAASSVTGDLEIIARIKPGQWSSGIEQAIYSKHGSSSGSYYFALRGTGALLVYLNDGTTNNFPFSTVSTDTVFTDGEAGWVRVTADLDNGAGNYEVKFFTAPDQVAIPSSWTQLGATKTGPAISALADTADDVFIGRRGDGARLYEGTIYRAQLYDGINGTLVADFNLADSSEPHQAFVSSTTGESWTINRSSTGAKAAIVDRTLVLMDGQSATSMEILDGPDLDLEESEPYTAAIFFRIHHDDGSDGALMAKRWNRDGTDNVPGWAFRVINSADRVYGYAGSQSGPTEVAMFLPLTYGTSQGVSMVFNEGDFELRDSSGVLLDTSSRPGGDPSNDNNIYIGGAGGTLGSTQEAAYEFLGAAIFREALTEADLALVAEAFGVQ